MPAATNAVSFFNLLHKPWLVATFCFCRCPLCNLSAPTTDPQNHRTTEPQNHRTTEPQNHRTTEPQIHRKCLSHDSKRGTHTCSTRHHTALNSLTEMQVGKNNCLGTSGGIYYIMNTCPDSKVETPPGLQARDSMECAIHTIILKSVEIKHIVHRVMTPPYNTRFKKKYVKMKKSTGDLFGCFLATCPPLGQTSTRITGHAKLCALTETLSPRPQRWGKKLRTHNEFWVGTTLSRHYSE